MKGYDITHCEVQVDSNIWRWEATPCIRLTFENHANRLHIAKISSYIWSKFGLLCWDAFIVITGCMWPVGHILKCFILSQRAECSILASKWVRCSFLWHSASFGRGCKIWIYPCIQKDQKNPAEINHLIRTEAVGKTNAILCLQGAPQAMIKKIMDL